jgi:hypothetical protein
VCAADGESFGACGCEAPAPLDAGPDVTVAQDAAPDVTAPLDAAFDVTVPSEAGLDGGSPIDGSSGDASPDGPADSGVSDAPFLGDAPETGSIPQPANMVLLHAAVGVPPFRLCWATRSSTGTNTVVPLPPSPDGPTPLGDPGIYKGTIQGYTPSAGAELKSLTIVPYVVTNLATIARDVNFDGGAGIDLADGGPEELCPQLIGKFGTGGGRLVPGVDFFPLPPIPAGTLQDDDSDLLVLEGCVAGHTPNTGACGAGYDGGTNARFDVIRLDTTSAVPSNAIGVQFVQASAAIEANAFLANGTPVHAPASSGVVAGFLLPDAGWSAVVPSSAHGGYGEAETFGSGIAPSAISALVVDPAAPELQFAVATLSSNATSSTPSPLPYPGKVITEPDGGTAWQTGDLLTLPLSTIDQLSEWQLSIDPSSSPASFERGLAYTFVLVGDPQGQPLVISNPDGGAPLPNPSYDGSGLHFLAFPNRFALEP